MLKKIMITVLGLAASGFATAGTMGPVCTPGNVTVPCEARLWDLGAEALYLRSVYGSPKSYQTTTTNTYREIKNDWNWGYQLNGSYHFNTGNDVTVNWMHFSSSANQANLVGYFTATPIPTAPGSMHSISRNRLDQVNIVMGQHVDLGLRDKMRFYAGMQYANIQATAENYFAANFASAIAGSSISVFDNTDYKGFGPSMGIDYSYDLLHGISLTANGSGSLLYGTTRYHTGTVFEKFELIASQVYASKKAIVPSLEAKLGLNYAYSMVQGVVNLNAGYQVVNYFNPLNAQFLQQQNAAISSVNYGLYGPYFGLKYVGNA